MNSNSRINKVEEPNKALLSLATPMVPQLYMKKQHSNSEKTDLPFCQPSLSEALDSQRFLK